STGLDGEDHHWDFGVGAGGYRSDITRTVFIHDVSREDREFYDCVLAANTLGRDIARPGLTAHALDDGCRGHLEQSRFSAYVVHKTGHGLGLEVHEAPQVMRGNHVELAAGNVVTIEPGLYWPGRLGVRIEDDVLITGSGCESLSTSPRELQVIA
ncbi:MAG: M24 family metallopeptidase, partial [Sphingomonadaceae bacterium]|nr:M24 family metallopeptidase [Sphingomonadaceae bacterium]